MKGDFANWLMRVWERHRREVERRKLQLENNKEEKFGAGKLKERKKTTTTSSREKKLLGNIRELYTLIGEKWLHHSGEDWRKAWEECQNVLHK